MEPGELDVTRMQELLASARSAARGGPWERASPGATGLGLPELADDGLLSLVADNIGIPLRLVRAAVRYWASYPDEIDAEIAAADAAEQAWRREHQLLAR